MKRTITFTLIALMFLALFTGCNTYRRSAVTTPENGVVDGNRVTRGHNRTGGALTDGHGVRGHHGRGGHVTRGHHNRHHGATRGNVYHDYASRSADGYSPAVRGADGAAVAIENDSSARYEINGVTTPKRTANTAMQRDGAVG